MEGTAVNGLLAGGLVVGLTKEGYGFAVDESMISIDAGGSRGRGMVVNDLDFFKGVPEGR
jgi:hypothetical protein